MTNLCAYSGKPFLSATVAKGIAGRLRRDKGGEALSAYRCWSCGKWHVGTDRTPKGVDKKRKK